MDQRRVMYWPPACDFEGFRWLSAQKILVAGNDIWAFRMSYAGELGWEFHMPRSAAWMSTRHVGGRGQACNNRYGSFAMNVMRMEKGFKGAGELTNEVTLKADVCDLRVRIRILEREKTLNTDLPWVCAYQSNLMARLIVIMARLYLSQVAVHHLSCIWTNNRQDISLCLHQTQSR